jgi:hypothetical protein
MKCRQAVQSNTSHSSRLPFPPSPSKKQSKKLKNPALLVPSKNQSTKKQAFQRSGACAAAAMGPSWCRGLRLLILAFLLIVSVAALPRTESLKPTPPDQSAADALVARMCDPGITHRAGAPPLTLCRGLHLRRRHGGGSRHHHQAPVPVALPPPGRGGEDEIDVRYGVAKRLVPTGPNPLHN